MSEPMSKAEFQAWALDAAENCVSVIAGNRALADRLERHDPALATLLRSCAAADEAVVQHVQSRIEPRPDR